MGDFEGRGGEFRGPGWGMGRVGDRCPEGGNRQVRRLKASQARAAPNQNGYREPRRQRGAGQPEVCERVSRARNRGDRRDRLRGGHGTSLDSISMDRIHGCLDQNGPRVLESASYS